MNEEADREKSLERPGTWPQPGWPYPGGPGSILPPTQEARPARPFPCPSARRAPGSQYSPQKLCQPQTDPGLGEGGRQRT